MIIDKSIDEAKKAVGEKRSPHLHLFLHSCTVYDEVILPSFRVNHDFDRTFQVKTSLGSLGISELGQTIELEPLSL